MDKGPLSIRVVDPAHFHQLSPRDYDVVLLDLDEHGFDRVMDCLPRARPPYLNEAEEEEVSAVIVVVGRSSELKEAQRQILVDAGAIFYEKPEGEDWREYIEKKLNETYRGALPDEAQGGYVFESEGTQRGRADTERDNAGEFRGGENPPGDDSPADDPSLYAEPPFRVSPDDYARLLNRMQAADDDWRKDD